MSKKLQERKKKRREQENKGKVIRRREAVIKRAKYEKSIASDVHASRDKMVPFVNPYKEELRKQKAIEHNMEVLKKLEEAHKREQDARNNMNGKLEAAGCESLKDKIQKIGEEATKAAGGISLIEKTRNALRVLHGEDFEEE